MYAFVTKEDVQSLMPPFTPEQERLVDGYIAQAATNLQAWALERGHDLQVLMDGSALRYEIAKGAVVASVKRALGNLDGAAETTNTVAIDDYRETTTIRRDASLTSGALTVQASDIVGLLPGKRNQFGTLRMGSAL
ncbi:MULTISPECIES: hypothetical protein [unclassified Microbacterium]|uniref:hypothetical protein n=1 Tax=unclassified Microbacterium TaxID=2609290 RepID=UPI00386BF143